MARNRLLILGQVFPCLLLGACHLARPSPPPEAFGSVPSAGGTAIAFSIHGVGQPVVLVHGLCCDRSFWKEVMPEVSRTHQAISLDLSGHGDSGRERASWGVEDLAADVQAVVEALDLRDAVLVGHSMGGPVCLAAAARMPGRVVGAVVVDTLHDAEMEWPKGMADDLARRFGEDFEGSIAAMVEGSLAPGAPVGLADWITARAVKTDPAAAIALLQDFPNLDLPRLLQDCPVPVRALNSARTMATQTERNCKYADFDAVVLEDTGHFPMLERPEEFAAALRRALEGFPPPPGPVLYGRVTDPSGRPMGGVEVTMYAGFATRWRTGETRTSGGGWYRFPEAIGSRILDEAEDRWDVYVGVSVGSVRSGNPAEHLPWKDVRVNSSPSTRMRLDFVYDPGTVPETVPEGG